MDSQTIIAYNKHAKNYDEETKDFWKLFPSGIIDYFVNKVSGRVLDVGSGPGRDAEILRSAGLNVVCLDASDQMVKLTLAKNFESVCADLLELPFPDQSFEGVWAYTSLLHIAKKDISKALSEVKRVLKPNGTLGLGMIEGNSEIYKESPKVKSPRFFAYYKKTELDKILSENGFQTVCFENFKPRTHEYLNYVLKIKS